MPVTLRSLSQHSQKDLEGDTEALSAGVTSCLPEKGPLSFIWLWDSLKSADCEHVAAKRGCIS